MLQLNYLCRNQYALSDLGYVQVRIQMMKIIRIAGSNNSAVATRNQDDEGVNHIRRVTSPTQLACRLCPGLGQILDGDTSIVQKPGEIRLARAISPRLGQGPGRHQNRRVQLQRSLNQHRDTSVATIKRDQRPGIQD